MPPKIVEKENYYNLICKFVSMKQRIYIDTSVLGGYFDEEFKEATRSFLKDLKITKLYLLFLICLM